MALLSLPNELLLLVADQLPLTAIPAFRRTCKRIFRILKKLNRKRVVMDDVISCADFETMVMNPKSRMKLKSATALEISAITVLPPVQSHNHLSLSSFLSSFTSNARYFSLYLVPECEISVVPAPSPATPLHLSLTHLSIINFQVSPSFLALFPALVEVTLALLLTPLQSQVHSQYQPRDVRALLSSLPSPSLERLTISCTNCSPDLVALAAQRFPNLTHLSFAWVDAPDRLSCGVESTDLTHVLHQYADAIAPLADKLQALYLPACVGIPTYGPGAFSLPAEDELLGEGPVLLPPAVDSMSRLCFNEPSYFDSGLSVRRTRVQVGMKVLLDACRTLVRGIDGRHINAEYGMHKLDKIGWLIPQGDGLPLLPIECVRRRGVVKFGATSPESAPNPIMITNGVIPSYQGTILGSPISIKNSTPLPSLSPAATLVRSSHQPRSVPITVPGDYYGQWSHKPINEFSPTTISISSLNTNLTQLNLNMSPTSPVKASAMQTSPVQARFPPNSVGYGARRMSTSIPQQVAHASSQGYREETEYWYPNMEWADSCAWPVFSEIETVFPRPECMSF
ncbi:hypothetical protein CPB86DRAFT_141737 [Serendipita vermifera]|nr:hypothetical protein CPB86DRAFT_141737 [Serendipita vermifera]